MCSCRRCVSALELIARNKVDMHLTLQNEQAMGLTHGFAHGLVQSVLFSIRYACACLSWLQCVCAQPVAVPPYVKGCSCVTVHDKTRQLIQPYVHPIM